MSFDKGKKKSKDETMHDEEETMAETEDTLAVNLEGVTPKSGEVYTRPEPGDYRLRIASWTDKASKGKANASINSVVEFVFIEAYNEANKGFEGARITSRYAGSDQSHSFMKERLACLLDALKIRGAVSKKAMVGKEIDASVIWKLDKPQQDPTTGRMKRSVFVNVIDERPVGAPRSVKIRPEFDSMAAKKYLEADDQGSGFQQVNLALGDVE